MKNTMSIILLFTALTLTACGGGSSNNNTDGNNNTKSEPVAMTISPASAQAIIDGDDSTSWTANNDEKIVIDLGSVQKIKQFELNRVAASATSGSNPDILIELSINGTSYEKSNVSVVFGGKSCFKALTNATTMLCEMVPSQDIRYVRISIAQDKSFDLTEFKVLSE